MMGIYIFKKAQAVHEELKGYEKLKSEAIMNFPIPNSKNDLLEFSIFVESRVKPINYLSALSQSGADVQKWNRIWQSKAEQIQKKAQIAFAEDRSSLTPVNQNYQSIIEKYKKNEKIQWTMIAVLAAAFIVFLVLYCVSQA